MRYNDAFERGFIGSETKYNEFIDLLALDEDSIPEGYEIDKIILDNEICKNIEIFLDLTVDQNIVIKSRLNSGSGKTYNLFLHNGYAGTHSRRDFISFTPVASYSFTRATSDDIILGEIGPDSEFFTNIHYSEETKILVVNTFDKEVRLSTDLYNLQETLSGKLVLYTKIPMDSLTGSIDIVKFPYYVESDYELAVVDGFRGTETDFAAIGTDPGSLNILFRVENSDLQVSYDGGANWNPLYDLGSLKGKSAYELAVDHGYLGTEEEWIKSLEPVNGKSAYQIAVEYGFAGTAQEWLDYLKGGGSGGGSSWPGLSTLSDNALENKNGIYLSKSLLGGSGGSAIIPEIGPNGNWWLDGVDTGKPSRGSKGETPYIGSNGNWWIDGLDTGKIAQGQNGESPVIGSNGTWWVGALDTGVKAQGENGTPFEIYKIFNTISEMEAEIDNIPDKKFILINNKNDITDADNGKIYIKDNDDLVYAFQFTGFQSIKGDKGDTGLTGPAPLLRKKDGYIQVSYDKGYIWTNLISLSDLTPLLSSELLKVSDDEFNAIEQREDGIYVAFPTLPDSGEDPVTSVIKYYLSNPSQTWSSDFTSTTYEGPEGGFVPARSSLLAAPIVKRLNLPHNFVSQTDDIIIQVSLDKNNWFDIPISLSGKVIPSYDGSFGLGIEYVSDKAINLIIGKGISSTVPWDFNFWYRVCIQRFVNVLIQYPTKSTIDKLSDSDFLSIDNGIVVREGSQTKIKRGIVLPEIPEEMTSATPSLISVKGKPQWSMESPHVVYNNIGGITPTGAVLSAPSINGIASYLKVDHTQEPKKLRAYCNWEKSNGYPLCNNPNYKTWSYGLFDIDSGYMYPIVANDYLGYFFYEDVSLNQIRLKFFDNYGVDPWAYPKTIEIFLTYDGVNWFSDSVKTFASKEYDIILDLTKTYNELRGFRVLFTNFATNRYSTSYVNTIDAGMISEDGLSYASSIKSAPFEVYPSDNFTKAPLILSFNDGFDEGGIRNIVKEYNGILECPIGSGTPQYIYASYDKSTDETELLAQTSLILEKDTGDRWYNAGNIASSASSNYFYSPGYHNSYYPRYCFDNNTGNSWISAPSDGNGSSTSPCIGAIIGQKNVTGQVYQITIVNRDTNYNPYNIAIEYSFDDINWHLLRYFAFTNFSGGGSNVITIPDYGVGMTPHSIRFKALDSGPSSTSWRIAEIYIYANRKYPDEQIIFNTRTGEYKNGFNDNFCLLYLGRITRNNNLENNIGLPENYIVDSSSENNAATLSTYNTSARWRTASKNTNSYLGLKNVVKPIGRIQWYTFSDANYNATSVAVEIQRDNNPAGTWESVGTFNIANTVNSTVTITPNYSCDTVHCIRVRLTANKDWIVYWAKFFETSPFDGNAQYHYHYQLHDQQTLGLKYESTWFAVGANGTYTIANKLASSDVDVELYWSPSPSYDGMMPVNYWRTEYGASVRVDRSNIIIRVGTDRTFYSNYTNSTGGYYKVILTRRY